MGRRTNQWQKSVLSEDDDDSSNLAHALIDIKPPQILAIFFKCWVLFHQSQNFLCSSQSHITVFYSVLRIVCINSPVQLTFLLSTSFHYFISYFIIIKYEAVHSDYFIILPKLVTSICSYSTCYQVSTFRVTFNNG